MKTSIKTIVLLASLAMGLTSPLFSQVPDLTKGTQSVDRNLAATPTPPVSEGFVCWFDAGVGVARDSNGVVRAWKDLSGNDHFATRTAGAPRLASWRINSMRNLQSSSEPL